MFKCGLIFCCLLFLFCCCEQKEAKDNTDFYLITVYKAHGNFLKKRTPVNSFKFHDNSDTLLLKKRVVIGDRSYELRKYTNYFSAPADGDEFCIELSDYGIIFSSSLSWHNINKLRCSNDSINNIFDEALDYAQVYSTQSCLNSSKVNRIVTFQQGR